MASEQAKPEMPWSGLGPATGIVPFGGMAPQATQGGDSNPPGAKRTQRAPWWVLFQLIQEISHEQTI